MWIACHHFGIPLKYTGFGGTGKQVRDLLHPADLVNLVQKQVADGRKWEGQIFNVGGGRAISASMREMTDACRNVTGREVPVEGTDETVPYDIPLYLTDHSNVSAWYDWNPRKSIVNILSECAVWIRAHEQVLKPLFCLTSGSQTPAVT
jgi:CDP-paratose 2-epimerase